MGGVPATYLPLPTFHYLSEITGQPWAVAWARRVSSGSTATGLFTFFISGRSLWESL